MNSLMDHAVPGIPFLVFKGCVSIGAPFLEQSGTGIFADEVGPESLFKRSTKGHGRTRFSFLPAIAIAVAIAARATQVLADLCVAKDHRRFLPLAARQLWRGKVLPNLRRERRNQGSGRSGR